MLKHKLNAVNGELIKVNTYKVKASQYNHIDNTYIKKDLTERWNLLNEKLIQRDLYSAYLLMHVYKNKINRDECIQDFDNFVKLHDAMIDILKQNTHNPSCMGI
jgi:hypothetical protein